MPLGLSWGEVEKNTCKPKTNHCSVIKCYSGVGYFLV